MQKLRSIYILWICQLVNYLVIIKNIRKFWILIYAGLLISSHFHCGSYVWWLLYENKTVLLNETIPSKIIKMIFSKINFVTLCTRRSSLIIQGWQREGTHQPHVDVNFGNKWSRCVPQEYC